MALDGGLRETLRVALAGAFTYDALRILLREKLDRSLPEIVQGGSLTVVVFDLLEEAERGGWLGELLAAAREANPGNEGLWAVLSEVEAALNGREGGQKKGGVALARLPATSAKLFGREPEMAWLDGCWNDRVHVVSVVAFGGVGKSALVNGWLAKVRDEGWRGAERVYGWSFYSQGTDRVGSSDEFFGEALRWFGDKGEPPGSPWEKGERLAEIIRRERTLLVLDGLEPMQWGPGVQQGKLKDPALEALVKELGAQNGGMCLITSRIAVADLEGLGGDKVRTQDLTHLSPEAGAELLRAKGAKGTAEELREVATE
jgi:hypothetical protein